MQNKKSSNQKLKPDLQMEENRSPTNDSTIITNTMKLGRSISNSLHSCQNNIQALGPGLVCISKKLKISQTRYIFPAPAWHQRADAIKGYNIRLGNTTIAINAVEYPKTIIIKKT